jgi:hypothetical protein
VLRTEAGIAMDARLKSRPGIVAGEAGRKKLLVEELVQKVSVQLDSKSMGGMSLSILFFEESGLCNSTLLARGACSWLALPFIRIVSPGSPKVSDPCQNQGWLVSCGIRQHIPLRRPVTVGVVIKLSL